MQSGKHQVTPKVSWKNGKAEIEIEIATKVVHTQEMAEVSIYSREGEKVCAGHIAVKEEMVFSTILLNPHPWKGWEDPYVYEVEVNFWQEGRSTETVRTYLTVRSVSFLPIRGFLLNEKEEELKAVRCEGEVTEQKFSLLKELNANVLWMDTMREDVGKECWKEQDGKMQNWKEQEDLQERCDREGILLCINGRIEGEYCCERGEKVDLRETLCEKRIPLLYRDSAGKYLGGAAEKNVLYKNGGRTDCFYYYKACWSRIPFVHICDVQKENGYACIEKTKDDQLYAANRYIAGAYNNQPYVAQEYIAQPDNAQQYAGRRYNAQRFENAEETIAVTVYSNQKKAALYVDGYLFECKQGPPDFKFEDISLKHCQTVLTAQAGECSISVTVERIFS